MSAVPKRKLCWNCEGNIALSEENCSFCGVFQNPYGQGVEPCSKEENQRSSSHLYALDSLTQEEEPQQQPSPLYEDPSYLAQDPAQVIGEAWLLVKPLVCLMIGFSTAFFSLLLFFFSHEGFFTLQWRADMWYIYILISLPALWVGFKSLNHLPDRPLDS